MRRHSSGQFRGKPPRLVPDALHRERARRTLINASEVCRTSVVDAVKLWAQVIEDERAPLNLRLKASELLVERVMGKPAQEVKMDVHVEEPAWVQAQRVVYEYIDPADETPLVGTPVPSQAAQVRLQQEAGLVREHRDIIDAEVVEADPATEPELDDDEWDDVVDSDADADDWTFPPDDS